MIAAGIDIRDRLVAALATVITLALFGFLLIRGLTVEMRARLEQPMALLDLRAPPPLPPARKPPVERMAPRHAHPPAPRNLVNKATPVVAPPPIVPLVVPPPIIAAPVAGIGAAASAGAADKPGPGTGAGGAGNGNGGGGDGDGDGDDTPPRQIGGRLKFSDLPADLREAGRGGSVAVRYQVEIDGHASGCSVTGSSGSAELDATTCRLIEQRFRFKPSRDADGDPVRSTVVETHSWLIDRAGYSAP